jgi:hypothetical protein
MSDEHDYGDCTFLVKQAQPSHTARVAPTAHAQTSLTQPYGTGSVNGPCPLLSPVFAFFHARFMGIIYVGNFPIAHARVVCCIL